MKIENPKSPLTAKLTGVHLFHFDGAPCAQRVRFALHEKGLSRGREEKFDAASPAACAGEQDAWVSRQVSLVRKQHMSESYAQIQPNCVVPALVHDGELHVESMDIIEYLDDAFGGVRLIPKHDANLLAEAQALTNLGKELHRSIRFVTFRWGLRGLARLSAKEEQNLRALLKGTPDGEGLIDFYAGYDAQTIPEAVYDDHLQKLNHAFADHERRLQDGRTFLAGQTLTMADVIWAMKTLRLIECDYPFAALYPAYSEWYQRISQRPAFREGVMGKHNMMSSAMRFKARVERVLGMGLRSAAMRLAG